MDEQLSTQSLKRILNVVAGNFTEEELQIICLQLGIDYHSLPATTKDGKVRELISYCAMTGKLRGLWDTLKAQPRVKGDIDLPSSV